jgi:hypothetical protein
LNPEAEKMGAKLTILFQHHKTDDVTRRRLETLARVNPGVSIVPLTHASDDVFPGTFNSARVPEFANENGWSGADVSIYAWFRHGRSARTTADRYVWVEYDMLYRVPMEEFYREVWDDDLAGAQLFFAGPHHHWNWFPVCIPQLPPEFRPFAAGITPLSGVLLAHRTLEAVAAGPIPPGIFAECRVGTLVNAHGFDMVEFPYPKKRNITWREEFLRLDKETQAYHPLKGLIPLDEP